MSTTTSRTFTGLLAWLLLSLLGVSSLHADPSLIIDVEQALTPPAIDGEVGEWEKTRWIPFAPGAPGISSAWDLVDDGPTEPWGTAGTAADLSGSFAFQWDEAWLYLAAQVTDNVHDVEGRGELQWFLKDSISLFLDIPLDGDGPAWIAGDHAFSFVADPTYPEDGKWWRHGERTGHKEVPSPPETRLAVHLGERGNYILEAALPMAALTKITPDFHPPFANRMVGFLFLVADPDKGPDTWGGQLNYGGDHDNDANWARLRFVLARTLPAEAATLSGKVVYQHDGAAWAGGTVRVKDQEGKVQAEARTSAEGQYQLQIAPGRYQVHAGSQSAEVEAGKGAQLQVDLSVPPTLARLSFAVPPAQQAAVAAFYAEQVIPPLHRHGLIEWTATGRATPDSIFSRLFVLPTPSEVVWKWMEVQTDPAWWEVMRELGRTVGLDRPLRTAFQLYEAPAGVGRAVRSGPGEGKQGKGQNVVAGPGIRQGDWLHFSPADGLPNARISTVLQDSKGNLWLGTEGRGVCRYDGQQWTTFTTRDGLGDNAVWGAAEDTVGNLWFDTWSGVSRYDGREFRTFTVQDGLPADPAESMLVDRKGRLWVGTLRGLCRYDGQTWTTFAVEDGLPGHRVISIREDAQGKLWFGTAGGGLCRYDGEHFTTFTLADGLAYENVGVIAEDRQGNLWVGTREFSYGPGKGGVSRYDGKRFVSLVFPDTLESVGSITEDPEGNLWFGTQGSGLWRYDGRDFEHFTTGTGLPDDYVVSGTVDREESLWFGTGGGVSRYEGAQLRSFTAQEGLADNSVNCALEDRQGGLWFGTDGGVSRYDGQGFKTFTIADGLGYNRVASMVEDLEGNLWFCTDDGRGFEGGISHYDGHEVKIFTAAGGEEERLHGLEGLGGNMAISSVADREGKLWFGQRGGVSRYDGRQFRNFTTADGLVNPFVSSILADRKGQLWFGTWGGVSRYDGRNWASFTSKDGLTSGPVRAIAEDRQGYLWFGTEYGVSRYDGQGFKTFTMEDGLADNQVWSVIEDREGKLWFGTEYGVSRYDGLVFQSLHKQDGLAGNSVQALLQARDGDIWIATDQGVTRYRPSRTPPLIHLSDVVADRPYGPLKELRLPSSQKFLAFEFRGLSFKTRPGQMAYVYQLEGHDPDWQVTRENRVEYTDLPVGTYTFQVKAVDRDLNYSEAPATVAVEVFYQAIVSPVRLAEVHLQDLFASFYKTYNTQPLGTVQVVNDAPDSVAATLSFFLPDYMRRPSEQPLVLFPQSSQQVEVRALLDEQVLTVKETVPVQAEVSLVVASGEQSIAVKEKHEILLHGRGALTWEGVGKAAAFITPDDPAVSEFARSTLVAFEEQIKSLGKPCRNLLRAMVLLEALKVHGVRYIPDANTPYGKVSADRSAVDHISYPSEVLQGKTGDCDDLTVLFCALLENAGVSTALVDAPGHIFLLFDSGVSRQEVYKLPVEEKLYVVRGDRVWVPVEVTLVGEGFARAWQAGAEELVKVKAERERVVDTQAAWEVYAPASPVFAEQGSVPSREETQEGVRAQYATLEQQLNAYIEQTYLYPLKTHPDNAALWSELARVYVALGRYDAAIKSAHNRLRQQGGEDATTLNQVGIAYYLKGEVEQAAYFFKKAVDLAPADTGIRRNLDKTMAALGEAGELKGKPPAEVAGSEELGSEEVSGAKAGQVEMDEDSFYWGE